MAEISVVFGPRKHLSGTLTLPPNNHTPTIGVILLNAGVIHRIGPHRFNVKLARRLAQFGAVVLRFDLSGQGDSEVHPQALPFQQQAVADLCTAMDHLARVCDVDRFIVGGICSGAFNGLATAVADKRVAGLWMLDGYTYPTSKTGLMRYQRQLSAASLRTLGSWTRTTLKRCSAAVTIPPKLWQAPAAIEDGHHAPPREQFGRDIQALVDRGTSIYFIFTGSELRSYSYPEQLRDAFADFEFIDHVRCEHRPNIDHTATTLAAQQTLVQGFCEWLPEVARQAEESGAVPRMA